MTTIIKELRVGMLILAANRHVTFVVLTVRFQIVSSPASRRVLTRNNEG